VKKHIVGDKNRFSIQVAIYSETEINESGKECEWWGDEYAHGFLTVFINGSEFGEKSYIYPFQPTVSSAISNPLNRKDYPGLLECSDQQLFDAFEYAYKEQPDVDDPDNPFDGDSTDLTNFVNSSCSVNEVMPDFLYEYVVSSELSSSNILIGSFAFQQLETIVVRSGERIRFSVKDLKDLRDERVSGCILKETEYQSLWREIEEIISR